MPRPIEPDTAAVVFAAVVVWVLAATTARGQATRPFSAAVTESGRLTIAAPMVDGGGSTEDEAGLWVSREGDVVTVSQYPASATGGSGYCQYDGHALYLSYYRPYTTQSGLLTGVQLAQAENGEVWGTVTLRTPPNVPDLPVGVYGRDLYDLCEREPVAAPLIREALEALGTRLADRPPSPWRFAGDIDAETARAAEALLLALASDDWRARARATEWLRSLGPAAAAWVRDVVGVGETTPEQSVRLAEAFGPLPAYP